MANGEVQLIFNTPSGKGARTDEGKHSRRSCVEWSALRDHSARAAWHGPRD
jgi:hypothetical protein